MKNIWILNHYASTPFQGGITRHYDFAKELVNRGYYVTIFTSSYNHYLKSDVLSKKEIKKEEDVNGVRYVWVKTYPWYCNNGIKRILNMFSFLISMLTVYKLYEKPSVVIGSSIHLFSPVVAYLIARRTNAKYLCEIRDLWPQTLIDMGAISKNHPLAVFFRLIEKFIYKKASKIIVLLPGAYEYIKKYKVDYRKIAYIPNGVNISWFDKCKVGINIDKDIDQILSNYFCCLYTGAHGIPNCLNTIVEAASIVKQKGYDDIKFIFIGEGSEKEYLIEYCKKNKINNSEFFSSTDKDIIPAILTKAQVCLLPTRDISLYKYGISPNKLFDYMAAGKPVVFSGNVYNDIIKESNSGISIEPENSEAFADAIIRLYNISESERIQMGLNGRKYIEQYHNIDILVNKLEECFE